MQQRKQVTSGWERQSGSRPVLGSKDFFQYVSYLDFFPESLRTKHFFQTCSLLRLENRKRTECQSVLRAHQIFPCDQWTYMCRTCHTSLVFLSGLESGISYVTWLDYWMLMNDWWENSGDNYLQEVFVLQEKLWGCLCWSPWRALLYFIRFDVLFTCHPWGLAINFHLSWFFTRGLQVTNGPLSGVLPNNLSF